MTQAEINLAVARATGETVATVKRLGFLLADPDIPCPNPDCEHYGPRVLDWDELDAVRYGRREAGTHDAA